MFKVYHEDFKERREEVFASDIYIEANHYAKRYANDLLDQMDETAEIHFANLAYDECHLKDSAGLQHVVSVRHSN